MPFALKNRRIHIANRAIEVGTGWLPPMYDPRDYVATSPKMRSVVDQLEAGLKAKKSKVLQSPPSSMDLRAWCSPIEDQMQLGSCTANAAIGVVEYYERRANSKHIDGSRLFVYKATRNLIGVTGDTGAWLRNTMAALVVCGVPNERYWPYSDAVPAFDVEPPPFVYAVADNYESLKYFAHDPIGRNIPGPQAVDSVKKYVAAGVPSMFGFFGYTSFDSGDQPGHIPLPTDEELAGDPEWGHAIVAVGYNDTRKITNSKNNVTTKGAFLIRNSWGTGWGDKGYGWMPYDYALRGPAMDFWSLLKMEWVDTDQFFE